ncbi:CaiB/BaiF CoA transferase family protein [Pseudonocardia sp. GCM10023141]|uniref:CaiB/BaiF CoA transferase family protein n=1 Tax=Pseudonocardia sp. GCM10023141 TaxID=3252653 RepID=UPI00361BC5F6
MRVVSLAEQYPGPFATMLLADMGADVVLVERPRGGDPTRRFSGHFEALNRNKRSIAVDLKQDAGRAVFLDLVAGADVLIEGFRPGVMARLGLDPVELQRRFPDLVCASVSSFGQTGPLGARGGHDLSVQGLAGYVQPGDRPAPAPLPLADIASAMFAALGIVSALLGRERGGRASRVDVSMLDSLVSWRSTAIVSALNGLAPAPYPPEDPGYGVFAVGTGGELFTLSIAGEDHQWHALCTVLGRPDMATIEVSAREARREELSAWLAETLRGADPRDLEAALAGRGVGFGLVNDDAGVAKDPQVVARGVIAPVTGAPGLRVVRQPVLFDDRSGPITRPAPKLGEHTREILAELGYAPSKVEDLLLGVVVAASEEQEMSRG